MIEWNQLRVKTWTNSKQSAGGEYFLSAIGISIANEVYILGVAELRNEIMRVINVSLITVLTIPYLINHT